MIGKKGDAYIGNTSDSLAFEFSIVEFFDCRAEIIHSFVFDKATQLAELDKVGDINLPTAVALSADFRVDNVQSRLAGEVL